MKQTKFFTLLLCNFIILHFAQAQTAALSFVNPTIVGNKLQVTIRMASVGGNFGLGYSNFRLNYAVGNLSNPTLLSENFPSPAFGTTTTTGTNTTTGIVSINTILAPITIINSNILPITAAGVDLVTLQFNILNGNTTTTLSWRTTGTTPVTTLIDDDKATNRAVSTATSLSINLAHSANAGDDVTINCANPTAALYASGGSGIYTWSTGATTAGINVSPATTTTYSVTATNGQTDQVTVFVNKSVNAGLDVTTNCTTPTATLTATCGTGGFLWNTGATTASITVNPANTTTYSVTTTNGTSDQVTVFVNKTLPTANAGADISIDCYNPTANLLGSGTGIGLSYTWNTAQYTANISVTPSITTTYILTTKGTNGCIASDQVTVFVDKTPPTVNIGSDITVACNATAPVTFTATGTATGVNYAWSTGATLASINVSPTLTAIYGITVTKVSNGCIAMDDVILENPCNGGVKVTAKVNLASLVSQLMSDYYASPTSNFPLSDPYVAAPFNTVYTHVNNPTIASIPPSVLTANAGTNNAIVDWIFLELRQGTSGATTVAYTKTALLQADGDIVATDGVSPVNFPNATAGLYYVAVRYQNHLGFRTANKFSLTNSPAPPILNFTNNSVPLYGLSPLTRSLFNYAIFTMVPGDANYDGSIDTMDSAIWETQNGTFSANNYYIDLAADFNLDGSVDALDSALWELNNGSYQELD